MKISKIFHGCIFIYQFMLFFISFPLAFILYGKKHYWLISEVDFDARDNGFVFFKYLRENHKEINSIYLISKNNPNYFAIKNIGETLEPHSYKHWLIFISSKVKISTLVHCCSPSSYITKLLLKFHCTGKNVALKHGIFKNLHPNYFFKNAHLDLICCGAKPEYDFIKENFGYEDKVIKYTGLARFDELHNFEIEREIFIMPTWRRWLDCLSEIDNFKETAYFVNWFSLLKNKDFVNFAKNNGYTIYFYVHPKLNKFIRAFRNLNDINFLNSTNGDSIQKHLKSCSIFITDFSSTFFDIAYMRKPAVYFQFDEKQYFQSHYIKAYFDYRDDGFGLVTTNVLETINEVKRLVANKSIDDKFLFRINTYFPLNDVCNCERIFDSIMKII